MAGRGGPRPGAGRKKREKPPHVADKNAAGRIIDALNSMDPKRWEDPEVAGWAGLWWSLNPGIRLDTRKYLYDKRDGKAVHTVNHMHDKPMEHLVTHTISERMKLALEKAEKRVSGSR